MTVAPSGSAYLLLIGPNGLMLPRFSARFAKQDWEPIEGAGVLRRDINFNLVNLAPRKARKYKTDITCSGVIGTPAFNDLFPGDELTIHCLFEWGKIDGSGDPIRTPVEGSLRTLSDGSIVYRPILECLIEHISGGKDEWPATQDWKISASEI